MAPRLEPVELVADSVLFEAGTALQYLYFPEDGLVALMARVKRDQWVEVGTIGSLGAVGMCLVLGGRTANYRALVLQPGRAWRMGPDAFQSAVMLAPSLAKLLYRYVDAYLMQISQTAACNGHHAFRQRLCRWLMLSRDLLGSDELSFSQALIARTLMARVATVSEVFGHLKREGLITSGRGGMLRIIDPSALEAACCGCYGIIRDRNIRLVDEYRQLASGSCP